MLWKKAGLENMEKTLSMALEEARRRKIDHIVIASTTGRTIESMLKLDTGGINLVAVSYHIGFREPGKDELSSSMRRSLQERGVDILTTTHVLAGVDRTLKKQFGGLYPPEIIAHALRMFGQGVKVCTEISIMALDAGKVPYGQDIVAVGGHGKGADTACIIRPEHSTNVFATKVKEILCRPSL